MKKKLSIIIPAYQVEEFVKECLDSIFSSKRSDFEVVLVDDGSKDKTLEICRIFAKNHDNLNIYTQKNAGVSVARNNGIKYATGEYVMFLDSDDMLTKNWDNILNRTLTKDIYYINSKLSTTNKTEIMDKIIGFSHGKKVHLKNDATYIPGPVSKLYKRELLLNNSIEFKQDIIFAEDMLFNIRALNAAESVGLITNSIYLYRILSKSTTRTFNEKIFKSCEIFCNEIESIFGANHKYTIFLKQKSLFDMILKICMLPSYRDAEEELKRLSNISYYQNMEYQDSMSGFKKKILKLFKKGRYRIVYRIMKPAIYLKFYRKNERIEKI